MKKSFVQYLREIRQQLRGTFSKKKKVVVENVQFTCEDND